MNMREPQQFDIPTSLYGEAQGGGGGGGGGFVAALCLLAASGAWLFFAYWNIQMVAYGIESAHLYPPALDSIDVMHFSISLQIFSCLFTLVTPFFFDKFSLSVFGWEY